MTPVEYLNEHGTVILFCRIPLEVGSHHWGFHHGQEYPLTILRKATKEGYLSQDSDCNDVDGFYYEVTTD